MSLLSKLWFAMVVFHSIIIIIMMFSDNRDEFAKIRETIWLCTSIIMVYLTMKV